MFNLHHIQCIYTLTLKETILDNVQFPPYKVSFDKYAMSVADIKDNGVVYGDNGVAMGLLSQPCVVSSTSGLMRKNTILLEAA